MFTQELSLQHNGIPLCTFVASIFDSCNCTFGEPEKKEFLSNKSYQFYEWVVTICANCK